jgi:carboxylate-amine ligase
VIDTPHYHRVEDGLKYVAWRNNTFSLHVHIGVNDIDRAVRVCDRLRGFLPLLLALSANSPFLDGRLAGLHSARSQTFTRSFPRCGVPYAFGGWPAFRDYIDLLIRTQSIIEFTQIWWSVRPHFDYGTVEVRICDVQYTAGESDALAGLIVACAAQALLEVDSGEAPESLPGYLIEENIWRAIRHGLDGRMIDFERGEEYESSEIAERLLAWTAPARAAYGLELAPLGGDPNGAQRQRAMIDGGASMREAFETCVRDTRATYFEEVRA